MSLLHFSGTGQGQKRRERLSLSIALEHHTSIVNSGFFFTIISANVVLPPVYLNLRHPFVRGFIEIDSLVFRTTAPTKIEYGHQWWNIGQIYERLLLFKFRIPHFVFEHRTSVVYCSLFFISITSNKVSQSINRNRRRPFVPRSFESDSLFTRSTMTRE